MGIFKSKEQPASEKIVGGIHIRCQVCEHSRFSERKAQLNTAALSFFDLDWLNKSARCLVCEKCGYIHWFLPME